MKLAAIDIGSNAVRLLLMDIYETIEGPKFIKNCIYRVPLRLGEEAFMNGKISEKRQEMLVKTMIAFKNLMEVHETNAYMAMATSAMREASNSKEIVRRVKEETGIEVKVIEGNQEADIIITNHLDELNLDEETNYMYIDVGGGSTELSLIAGGELVDKWSFNIGTLRIKNDQVKPKEWKEMKSWLLKFRKKYSPIVGIGSGGNINSILKNFTRSKQNYLTLDIIDTCYRMLKEIPDRQKTIQLGLKPDRADVIVPALEIFRKVMNWLDMETIYVPKQGLPDGMIKQLYDELQRKGSKKQMILWEKDS